MWRELCTIIRSHVYQSLPTECRHAGYDIRDVQQERWRNATSPARDMDVEGLSHHDDWTGAMQHRPQTSGGLNAPLIYAATGAAGDV